MCWRCCAGRTTRATASLLSASCSCCRVLGRRRADRCLKVFEASGFAWHDARRVPRCLRRRNPNGRALMELMTDLMHAREWPGQLDRLRKWYEPQLERIVRRGQSTRRRPRAARALVRSIRDARAVRDGADARSAEGQRRSRGRSAARRGLSDALDRTFREGPGVGLRARAERHGRQLPERVRRRAARDHRGGAATAYT